jgi:hypothetical protein
VGKERGVNTTARIERARREMERLRHEALDAESGAARFGPDCKGCRHSDTGSPLYCRHPALQKVSVDWRGRVTMSGQRTCRDVRSEDGLCGPEAALFDERQWYRRVPWFAVTGIVWAGIWIAVGGFAIPVAIFGIMGPFVEWTVGRWS